MNIEYKYIEPGGNPTAIVTSASKRSLQPMIAKKIMKKYPACEQVGFLEVAKIPGARCRLQMMGGEFCGNALRALAVILADSQSRTGGGFTVESSGTRRLVKISSKKNKYTGWRADTQIFANADAVTSDRLNLNNKTEVAIRVELEGITYFLLSIELFNRNLPFKKIFSDIYKTKMCKTAACGLIFWEKIGANSCAIRPVVFVKKSSTTVMETACASGSAALALGLDFKLLKIIQPSGFCFIASKNLNDRLIVIRGPVGKPQSRKVSF